jgi:aspartyl protease family protein
MKMSEKEEQQAVPLKIGRGMIIVAWLALLVLLYLFFQNVLDRQYNPNQSVVGSVEQGGMKEVLLERNRMGHYVATGAINGVPVVFLLDTGATDVAVPATVAKRLGLRGGPVVRSKTAAGTVDSYLITLDRVSLGPIEMTDVRASILPTMEGEEILLGMSFLKRLEMVQRGKTLLLRQY